MITAAALCPAAPLLARELTGADPVVPELRRACLDAVISLAASAPDLVAVVGAGTQTRDWPDVAGLDLSAYAPSLGRVPGNTASVPLPLGLAAQLLDQAGYAGRRTLHTASESASLDECMALGKRLADLADDVGLLVMADGSARRGLRAPGYLDDRSAPFDAEVERAVRTGDLGALLAIDPDLARQLMATGRPAWQVLAAAMAGLRPTGKIRYWNDPFGVAYLVASLSVTERAR